MQITARDEEMVASSLPIADYLSGALLADCGAEGAQIINSAPIQAARRMLMDDK